MIFRSQYQKILINLVPDISLAVFRFPIWKISALQSNTRYMPYIRLKNVSSTWELKLYNFYIQFKIFDSNEIFPPAYIG